MTTRVALYGAGMISMAHGAAAQALGYEVGAVASRTPERAEKVATTENVDLIQVKAIRFSEALFRNP